MISRGLIAAGVLAAVFTATADGAQKRAGSTFESPLAQRIAAKTGVEVAEVACPARVGRVFHCSTVLASGDRVRVRVRIANRSGAFTWRLTGLLLRDLERRMERAMAESGDPGEVQCPWRRRVRTGDQFRCYGLNAAKTRAYNIDAVQIGGGLVRYSFALRP